MKSPTDNSFFSTRLSSLGPVAHVRTPPKFRVSFNDEVVMSGANLNSQVEHSSEEEIETPIFRPSVPG